MLAKAVFWSSFGLLLYTYLGYPLAVSVMARLRPRRVDKADVWPTVSLVIVAYNEVERIKQKIDNCLGLAYPANRLEIVLASDGSTDGTASVARTQGGHRVKVTEYNLRRGKASVLNAIIPSCTGEIVVLSDVRQMYEVDALSALIENFADPSVGAVSGALHLVNDNHQPIGEGVGFYWNYEKFIRHQESKFDSTVGATGAIYAIRRGLFEPIPADTLLDDVVIPMRIARRGYRVLFEPNARAFDRAARTSREEFARKVRTIAGNLQFFVREAWAWSPWWNRLWFQTMSHKLLRIVGPLLLVAVFVASTVLAAAPVYRLAVIGQAIFYGLAIGGCFVRSRLLLGRYVTVPYTFCLLNMTALVGIVRFFRRTQGVMWEKTADVGEVSGPSRLR